MTCAGRTGACTTVSYGSGRVRAFLRLVEDRALGLRAAVRLRRSAHRDVRSQPARRTGSSCCSITVAMVAARTFAMAANRVIDRQIDARNPRTAKARAGDRRRVASGPRGPARSSRWPSSSARQRCSTRCASRWRRSRSSRWSSTRTRSGSPRRRRRSSASPRRSRPVGAWIAVTGHWSWSAALLGLGGRHVDRRLRPHLRVPGRRGRPGDRGHVVPGPLGRRARRCVASRSSHVVTFALFVVVRRAASTSAGWWYAGLAVTAVAFVYEHSIVKPTTCPASTGRSSPPTASSASRCSASRWSTCCVASAD